MLNILQPAMSVFEEHLLKILASNEGDVIVVAREGVEFKAHSVILQACSQVHHATLTWSMREAATKRVMIDCDADGAKRFVRFLYRGALSSTELTSCTVLLSLSLLSDFYCVSAEFCAALSKQSGPVRVLLREEFGQPDEHHPNLASIKNDSGQDTFGMFKDRFLGWRVSEQLLLSILRQRWSLERAGILAI